MSKYYFNWCDFGNSKIGQKIGSKMEIKEKVTENGNWRKKWRKFVNATQPPLPPSPLLVDFWCLHLRFHNKSLVCFVFYLDFFFKPICRWSYLFPPYCTKHQFVFERMHFLVFPAKRLDSKKSFGTSLDVFTSPRLWESPSLPSFEWARS